MSTAQQPYFDCLKRTLHAALCIVNTPSLVVERHNKPEVEVASSPELLLNTLVICRDDQERTMIETSVNSVRVSICFKKPDATSELVSAKFVSFLAQRADKFHILRRKPVAGYDISFLITNEQTETMNKQKLIDFIIQFMADIDADIAALKLRINNRVRRAATEWLQTLAF